MNRRIAIFVSDDTGGIARYTHVLAGAMSSLENIEVHVVARPSYPWHGESGYTMHPILSGRPQITGKLLRKCHFIMDQIVNPIRFLRFCAREKITACLFANINHLGFPIWKFWLRNRSGFRFGVSVHDVKRQSLGLAQPLQDACLRSIYRRADSLYVHSTHAASELSLYACVAAERIHVVPHGVYEIEDTVTQRIQSRDDYGFTEEDRVGLFFGALRDEKNLDAILQALLLLPESCKLFVCAHEPGGSHKGFSYYESLITDLNLADRVIIRKGYLDDCEVGEVFSLADWVALAYDDSFTSNSGVLATAVAACVPILAATSPSLADTVTQFGIGEVSATLGADEIAEAIKKIVNSKKGHYLSGCKRYEAASSWNENAMTVINTLMK